MCNKFLKHTYIHGVFVLVDSVGVLLTGKAGTGKSKLAYELIKQNQTLVADDIVKCETDGNLLIGSLYNKKFKGIIYIRNTGLVDVNSLHENSVKLKAEISVCINLDCNKAGKASINICDVKIPFYNIKAGKPDHIYSIIEGLSIS